MTIPGGDTVTASSWKPELHAFAWLLGGDTLARIVGQLAIVATARLLGPEGYGAVAVALALFSIMLVLADFGVGDAAVREMTRVPGGVEGYRREVAPLRFWLASPWLIAGIAVATLGTNDLLRVSGVALAAVPFGVLVLGAAQSARIGQNFRLAAMWSAVLLLCLMFGTFGGAVAYRSAPAATMGLALALLLFALPSLRNARYGPVARETARGWMRRGLPYLVTAGAVSLYSRGDRVLLSVMAGAAAAGPYAAAYSVIMLAGLAGSAIHAALLPRLLLEFRGNANKNWLRRCLFVTGALIPLAVALDLAAPTIISVLYGNGYRDSVDLLRVLSPLVVLYVVNPMLSTCLIAAGSQTTVARIAVVNLIAAGALYPIGILAFGALGAAGASVAVECISGLSAAAALWKTTRPSLAVGCPVQGLAPFPALIAEIDDHAPS